MRPVLLKHLLATPALLIAAGLVLLGAASGRGTPDALGESASAERGIGAGPAPGRTVKPSFDALCRCLGASLAAEDEGAFPQVGLHAAFQPAGVTVAAASWMRVCRAVCVASTPRARLRQCAVGPSPPV